MYKLLVTVLYMCKSLISDRYNYWANTFLSSVVSIPLSSCSSQVKLNSQMLSWRITGNLWALEGLGRNPVLLDTTDDNTKGVVFDSEPRTAPNELPSPSQGQGKDSLTVPIWQISCLFELPMPSCPWEMFPFLSYQWMLPTLSEPGDCKNHLGTCTQTYWILAFFCSCAEPQYLPLCLFPSVSLLPLEMATGLLSPPFHYF